MESSKIRKWDCPHCSKKFTTKDHRNRHVVIHDPDGQVKCEICGKLLRKLFLPGHLSNVHRNQEEDINCNICEKRFCSLPNLRRHLKFVHSASPRERIPCGFDECNKTFLCKTGLASHFKIEHDKNYVKFPCAICGKEFNLKGILSQHIGTHTKEKPFKCSICGRTYHTKSYLDRHEATHLDNYDPTRFTCQECPRTFLTKDSYRNHIKYYHSTLKKYSCNLCQFKTQYRGNLSTHLKMRHDPDCRLFECYFCRRKFKSKGELENHIVTHTTEREECPCSFTGCGKIFSKKSSLTNHVKMEHTENPVRFGCTLCDKEFKNRTCLNSHIATHTTEKAYKCTTCGRRLAGLSGLIRHGRTHKEKSSQPMFPCKVCSRTYKDKNGLTLHVKIHHDPTVLPKHCCQFCGYKTYQKSHLNRHLNSCRINHD